MDAAYSDVTAYTVCQRAMQHAPRPRAADETASTKIPVACYGKSSPGCAGLQSNGDEQKKPEKKKGETKGPVNPFQSAP